MLFRTAPSRTRRRWAALALGCTLLVGGCAGDDGNEPADQQAGQTEPAADDEADDTEGDGDGEQPAPDDDTEDEAVADEATGDCRVGAGTVNEVVDVGVEIALDDVNELSNDGVSCIYDGGNDDLDVIVSVSVGTWDGSDERVASVVAQTEEYFGEPVSNPDLGDQAFLFDSDFGGTSLVVFVERMQYSIGIGGAGFEGTPLDSFDERLAMATELYEDAAA